MNNLSERIYDLSIEQHAKLLRQINNGAKKKITQDQASINLLGPYPLSFSQERIWLEQSCHPDSPFYNETLALHIEGLLRIDLLEQSLTRVINRHEVLRTIFNKHDGQIYQQTKSNHPLKLVVIDLRDIPLHSRDNKLQELIKAETHKPFKLDQQLLFRIFLYRLNDQQSVLVFISHHIIFDGWSGSLFGKETFAIYSELLKGKAALLPELPIKYVDYVRWQRGQLQGKKFDHQLSYWKRQLDGASTILELPSDGQRSRISRNHGACYRFSLLRTLVDELKELGKQNNATLFMVLLAAFKVMLHRYSGETDIIVGSPVAGRSSHQLENLIGVFINTIALRCNVSDNPRFNDLLLQVRETTLEAYANQDLPFEKMVSALDLQRESNRAPLFQIMFGLEAKLELPESVDDIRITPFKLDTGTSKLDISLAMVETLNGLSATLEYDTDLFSEFKVSQFCEHYLTLLKNIVSNPQQRISEISFFPDWERKRIIKQWNNTETPFSDEHCIHHLFEQQVVKTPEATALSFSFPLEKETTTLQMTYRELNKRANQLAHYILSVSDSRNGLVGICLERSADWIITVLAVLKTGKAYLPLDPTYPKLRLSFMLKDANPDLIITQQNVLNSLPKISKPLISLDQEAEQITKQCEQNLSLTVSAEYLAYVIYTSGSTGQPKGVLLGHRGLCNIVESHREMYRLGEKSRMLQFASFSFDGSVYEIFMALTSGAMLCMADKNLLQPGPALEHFMKESVITHAVLPPAVLSLLPQTEDLHLEVLLSTGDACLSQLVQRWKPICQFVNGYGPTECTVGTAMHECILGEKEPPIGRPFANVQIYILDSNLQQTAVGVPGELYIGGVGLANGYLNRPELTAEKFIPHPYSDKPGMRLYRSGDLARYQPNGTIQLIGRVDRQVKIRGFRIELGELETLINSHPAIKEAIVLVQNTSSGAKRLVSYVVCHKNDESSPSIDDLRNFIRERMPEYMVPAVFALVNELPLNGNGKVDHNALPKLDSNIHSTRHAVGPRNPVEEILTIIWRECLEISNVDVNDDFFHVGGNSLLITQLLMRINEIFRIDLPLRAFLEIPTIAGLAVTLTSYEQQPGHVKRLAELYQEVSVLTDQQAQAAISSSNCCN